MIVAFTLPAMGHAKPMMPLLRGLADGGEQIVCYGHQKFQETIRATGAEYRPYPEVPYNIDRPDFNLVRMGADLIHASELIYPKLLEDVRVLSPRLILQDFMALWASRIGTTLGVRRIHTVPTLVFNRETEGLMRREDGVAKLAGDVLRGAPILLRDMVRSRFAVTLREAFGLERSWRSIAPPACELVFSIEELQPGPPQGDVPRHYIGPSYGDLRNHEPTGMTSYCLITFGTLSNNDIRRFEAAMRGAFLAGLSAVVVCGGSKIDLTQLRNVARELEHLHPGQRALILESVPEMERWLHDAEIAVHHAGTGSTWETARFCKPAVFIPTISDQKVFATLLEAYGLGLRLPSGHELDAPLIAAFITQARKGTYDWPRLHARLCKAGGVAAGVRIIRAAAEMGP